MSNVTFALSLLSVLSLSSSALAATTVGIDRDKETTAKELSHDWSELAWLGDPAKVGSLPRAGAPGAPSSSTSAWLDMELGKSGYCATTAFSKHNAVRAVVLGVDDLSASALTVVDSSGSAVSTVYESASSHSSVPWTVIGTPGGALTFCIPEQKTSVSPVLRIDQELPDVELVAVTASKAEPGDSVRVEATLRGRGSRDNPKSVSITATTDTGQSVSLTDDGKTGDVEAGDGIYTGEFTFTGDRMSVDVQAEGSVDGSARHLSALVSVEYPGDGGMIDATFTTVADGYIRVLLHDADVGSIVRATFADDDRVLTHVAVRTAMDGDDHVAYIPRLAGTETADRAHLQLIPYLGEYDGYKVLIAL